MVGFGVLVVVVTGWEECEGGAEEADHEGEGEVEGCEGGEGEAEEEKGEGFDEVVFLLLLLGGLV